MTSPSPVVGDWYRRPNGALFEIVAIDRDDGTMRSSISTGPWKSSTWKPGKNRNSKKRGHPKTGPARSTSSPKTTKQSVRSMPAARGPIRVGSLDRSEASGYSEWPAPREL